MYKAIAILKAMAQITATILNTFSGYIKLWAVG